MNDLATGLLFGGVSGFFLAFLLTVTLEEEGIPWTRLGRAKRTFHRRRRNAVRAYIEMGMSPRAAEAQVEQDVLNENHSVAQALRQIQEGAVK